ncbi:hypothetical protein DFH06DRAFT_1299923 [Mycena polygramma]|nr:hypothetical protein DFH06DRAFT_1299923 [Mycena polygramma]
MAGENSVRNNSVSPGSGRLPQGLPSVGPVGGKREEGACHGSMYLEGEIAYEASRQRTVNNKAKIGSNRNAKCDRMTEFPTGRGGAAKRARLILSIRERWMTKAHGGAEKSPASPFRRRSRGRSGVWIFQRSEGKALPLEKVVQQKLIVSVNCPSLLWVKPSATDTSENERPGIVWSSVLVGTPWPFGSGEKRIEKDLGWNK